MLSAKSLSRTGETEDRKGMKLFSKIAIVTLVLAALAAPAAAVDLNSSYDLRYFPDSNLEFKVNTTGAIHAQGPVDLNNNDIKNFFASKCTSGQVIEQINADGSYSCVDPTEDASTEGLNATLLAGDIANTTIRMNGNGLSHTGSVNFSSSIQLGNEGANDAEDVVIGNSASASSISDPSEEVAIGQGASAGHEATSLGGSADAAQSSVAIGQGASASNGGVSVGSSTVETSAVGILGTAGNTDSVAVGDGSSANGDDGIAIGKNADLNSNYAIAITPEGGLTTTNAQAEGAIAIGRGAVSDEQYTTVIGSNSQPYDTNITGNLSVQGVGNLSVENGALDLNGNRIHNFFSSKCTSGQVVEKINADGSYSCVDPSQDVQVENLSETLTAGNKANTTLNMTDQTLVWGQNSITIGSSTTSAANRGSIVIGNGAIGETDAEDGITIGKFAKTKGTFDFPMAVGRSSRAGGAGATALGYKANVTDSGGAVALGRESEVESAGNSVAIGKGSKVNKDDSGAVVIGHNSKSSGEYQATFGNLNGEELDVNVTGNATIHGIGNVSIENADLDMNNNNISQVDYVNPSGQDLKTGGDLKVSGSIDETFADLAEIYPSDQELEKGEIVRISRTRDESVVRSGERFDESVGVVSTKPGFVMNSDEEGYPIALTGKVPVKVSMENGEIERGDRIVPSSEEGVGMRCEKWSYERRDLELRDIVSHNEKCEGSAIGKALEPASTNGKIMVMIDE